MAREGVAEPGIGPTTFARLLRHHRESAGLSQEALAERAGLSVDAVSALERGVRRTPRPSTVRLLAEALLLSPGPRETFLAAARPGRDRAGPAPAEPARGRSRALWPALAGATLAAVAAAAALVVNAVPQSPSPLEVSGVQVRAEPSEVAHCPTARVVLVGRVDIRAGAGTLAYHWVTPAGERRPDELVHLAAGVREVDVRLAVTYEGSRAGYGTALLDVTAPNRVSAPQTVVYACP